MRGVNVGGHKAFRPANFAAEITQWPVANIGAAGTFVVNAAVGENDLREELLRRLPFAADMAIFDSAEIRDLVSADPFARQTGEPATGYVSMLIERPSRIPALPICRPAGDHWQVKVVSQRDRFVMSLHRREGRTLVYPNEVVEKAFGVPATTRNWRTVLSVAQALA